jgi:AsmA protein
MFAPTQNFASSQESSMMKSRRIWITLATAGIVLLLVLLVLPRLLDADTYRGRIEAALSSSLGRTVQLGHLSVSLFSGSLIAATPSIADDPAFSTQPFLTAKDIRIGIETGAFLLHRELHIRSFAIDQPKIMLVRAENGTWNYSSLGGQGKNRATAADNQNPIPNLTVNRIEMQDGTVTLDTLPSRGQPHVYTGLNVSAQNVSLTNSFPFTASGKLPAGGTLEVSGNAGPINQHDASLTPMTAQVSLKHADLVAAGLVEPNQGVSGIADLESKIVSNGQTLQADGNLHLAQLTLAKNGSPSSQPVDLRFSVSQDLQALSGRIANANLQIGKAPLAITGTYQTRGNATTLQVHVIGQNLPINELVAFLPALGVHLPPQSRLQGGTLTTTLDVSGPTSAPVISGPIRIANTQLAGFDLGQKLASIQSLTGAKTGSTTTIQALSTDLHYGPDGTRTDNLAAVVSGLGSASGAGQVSAGGALNYHLLVKPDSSGVGGLATQAMSLLPGAFGSAITQTTKNGIPVTIAGTTANPTFTPDVSKMATGALQKQNQPSNPLGNVLGGLFPK